MLEQVEHYIKQHIPITTHTAFRLIAWDGQQLQLRCPLAANQNHHGTFFGGSLAMLSIVSAYALSFLLLRQHLPNQWQHCSLVIKDFHCAYKRPITEDALFISEIDSLDGLQAFIQTLAQRQKASLALRIYIGAAIKPQLFAEANFVAWLDNV